MIKDCLETKRYGIQQPHIAHRRYRSILSHQYDTIDESKHMLERHDRLGSVDMRHNILPLCTAVFELIDISTDILLSVKLIPRPAISGGDNLRIAYNRAHPCTQTSHSMIAFLETNLSFHGIRNPSLYIRHGPRRAGIVAHSLRILPIFEERPPAVYLPPSVIRQIVRNSVKSKSRGWRAALLSCGLVCRSWSHTLDLFFDLQSRYDQDKTTAVAVAHSLEFRPDRARLIRKFCSEYFQKYTSTDNETFLILSQALLTILTMAKSTKDIYMDPIHGSLLPNYIQALCQLRKVKRCVLNGTSGFLQSSNDIDIGIRRCMCLADIQKIITNWSDLRKLEISRWENFEVSQGAK